MNLLVIYVDRYKSYGGGSTQAADDDENGVFKVSSEGGIIYIQIETRLDRSAFSIRTSTHRE